MKDVIIEHRSLCMEPELVIDYSDYERRLKALEERGSATELRYNHNHDGRGRFTFSSGGGALKRVDKSGKSDKMKYEDSSGKRIRITQKAIDSVPDVTAFSSDELNQLVTDKCREILTDLKSDAVGTEETVSIKISSLESQKRKGGQGEGVVKGISFDEPYVSIHNHPSGKTISQKDVRKYIKDDSCIGLVVVGNQGSVYTMSKSKDYNMINALGYFLSNRGKADDRALWKGLKEYGIRYEEKSAKR